jgi:putative nucleotidyltransferase with HDIG domain
MKVQTVTSGSFLIDKRRAEILQAFLGSCVGVTLCDRKAEIGGLIHLLLPEPPSMDLNWNPEVSAATGMPIFLDALYKRGARKENLEACISGGALIDPVSSVDLLLDIGGRTAEVVQRILEKEKIFVRQIEVGGYFSCCLSLNLATLDTIIEPIVIPAPYPVTQSFKAPSSEQLDEVIERLLPIPQTALKIIRMINNADCSFRELAREVALDQVLSARLIRMCNAVSINASMKVDSIDKAMLRIGEKNLLLMALSFSMENFISHACQGYSLCKGGLYYHSVWTANLSSRLAEMTGKVRPDLAYTAGLLHDIGKVILDQYMDNAYPLFYRRLKVDGNDLLVAEKDLFGMAHTEAGHMLALKWDLPDFVSDTSLYHHNPEDAGRNRHLANIVSAANLLSLRFLPGFGVDQIDFSHLGSSLAAIGFDIKNIPALLASTPLTLQSAPPDEPSCQRSLHTNSRSR